MRKGTEVFEERSPFPTIGEQSAWEVDADIGTHPQAQQQAQTSKKKKQTAKNLEARELEQMKKSFPTFWEVVQQFKILEREGQPQSL